MNHDEIRKRFDEKFGTNCRSLGCECEGPCVHAPADNILDFILSEVKRAMPKTVEIEEDKPEYKDEMYCGWYKCSLCKVSNIFPSAKYCPECGAKIKFLNPKAE